MFVIFLLYLGASGTISINWEELWNALAGLLDFAGQAAAWLIGLIPLLSFMGSFMVGFALGFELG